MWKVSKLLLASLILCFIPLFGGSLRVVNDSPYHLSAKILAADGSHKGSISLNPQQQGQWQDFSGGNTAWSQTPYTVVLTCRNGKQFGVIIGVQQGATVSAMSASGPRYCEKPKKEEAQGSSKTDQQQTPFNPNQKPFNPNDPSSDSPDPSSSPGDPIWGPP